VIRDPWHAKGNPKYQALNPKEIQIFKIRKLKTRLPRRFAPRNDTVCGFSATWLQGAGGEAGARDPWHSKGNTKS
jgi:hypothetical protein